ncbi:MAG TPA: hypothetical protein DC032_09225 [Pseudomonas sp.]|nr:hypothetical protein [Pseudomonas sp.]
MNKFSMKLRELLALAEQTAGFYEVEVTFSIRLHDGNESYFLRLMSDSDSVHTSGQRLASVPLQNQWF